MPMPLLSILIPTYNRRDPLLRNLRLLSEYIIRLNYQELIEIIISDNDSDDDAVQIVKSFINETHKLQLHFYKQEENIGLERNAIFCLSKSRAKYVMYLGDDDYLAEEYLCGVIRLITSQSDIACVVPSTVPIDINGERLEGGGGTNIPTRNYPPGFLTARKLMGKGHQLSGVTFLRKGTLNAYKKGNQLNLYPFMFFIGFNCLRGTSIHLTDFPVRVTVGAKKDWDYGEDGLLLDIFRNTSMLFKNPIKQGIVELTILRRQAWRWMRYFRRGPRGGLTILRRIILCKHVSVITKIGLIPIMGERVARMLLGKLFRL
jgi:glycosyltransferase involved in cell wall biosynthesis